MPDGKPAEISAPWNPEQVAALNDWQKLGYVHEFTCTCGGVLEATVDGWTCPKGCGYRQTWAWAAMADRSHPWWTNPLDRLLQDRGLKPRA